jgi:hypothetical protein
VRTVVRRGRVRGWTAAAAVALLTLAPGRPAPAHPLHTSITELRYDPRSHAVVATIRVFEDDFRDAVARAPRVGGAAGYLRSTVSLVGSDGRAVPLQWKEAKRTEDLLWLTLRGTAPAGLRGGSIRNDLIFNLHADQVNIVKASYGGAQRTLLFTRGGGVKRLP